MSKKIDIAGYVRDQTSATVGNASVTFSYRDQSGQSTTENDGRFTGEVPDDQVLQADGSLVKFQFQVTSADNIGLPIVSVRTKLSDDHASISVEISAVTPLQRCTCDEFDSALGQRAYLADLLSFALKNVKDGEDPITLEFLSSFLHQPFADLLESREATESAVRQVRICVEVLRSYRAESASTEKTAAEKDYLFTAYQTLLTQFGASYEEIRLESHGDTETRTRLADRLGISLSAVEADKPDELQQLLLDPDQTHEEQPTYLSEEKLEVLFGLASTDRDPLSQGAKLNDPKARLSSWNLDNIIWNKNTDENGSAYVTLDRVDGKHILNVFRSPSAGQEERVADAESAALPSKLFLVPRNNSSLMGRMVAADDTPPQAGPLPQIEIVAIPRLLSWRLRTLRAQWRNQDRPTNGYDWSSTAEKLPIVDPELIGENDLRLPTLPNPILDLLTKRRAIPDGDRTAKSNADWVQEESIAGITLGPRDFVPVTDVKADKPARPGHDAARQQWQRALMQRSLPPIIDPDLVPFEFLADPISGDAQAIWEARYQQIQTQLESIKLLRQTTMAMSDELTAFGAIFLQNVGVGPEILADIESARRRGGDIQSRLAQLNISVEAHNFLLRMRKLAQDAATTRQLLSSEWDSVCAILVQAWKERRYAEWRDEEARKDIVLSPDHFRIPSNSYEVLRLASSGYQEWRVNYDAQRDWVDRLQARMDQESSLIRSYWSSVGASEAAALPALRDALIAEIEVSGVELADKAEWLGGRLGIDTRDSGSKQTTRVLQAIETLQSLLSGIRTGQFGSQYIGKFSRIDGISLTPGSRIVAAVPGDPYRQFRQVNTSKTAFAEHGFIPGKNIFTYGPWPKSVDNSADPQIELFAVRAETIFSSTGTYSSVDGKTTWSVWTAIPNSPRIVANAKIAASSDSRDEMSLFVISADDGHVYTTFRTSVWSPWERIGIQKFSPTSPITAIRTIRHSVDRYVECIDLYVVGLDGKIYKNGWHHDVGWIGWQIVEAPFTVTADQQLSVTTWHTLALRSYSTTNPAVINRQKFIGTFPDSDGDPKQKYLNAAVNRFALSNDGVLHGRWKSDEAVAGPALPDLWYALGPRQFPPDSFYAAVPSTPEHIDIFVISDGIIHTISTNKASGQWNQWTTISTPFKLSPKSELTVEYRWAGGPAPRTDTVSDVRIFVVAADGQLYSNMRSGDPLTTRWSNRWTRIGIDALPVDAPISVATRSAVDASLFFVDRQGNVQTARWNAYSNRGQWQLRTLTLSTPTPPDLDKFDREWQWMGTYETWRAAMFVFLYPENLLQPHLYPDAFASAQLIFKETAISNLTDRAVKDLIQPPNQQPIWQPSSREKQSGDLAHSTTSYSTPYFAIPILIAQRLQANREYAAALKWYREVYDFDASTADPRIFYGFIAEEHRPEATVRPDDWLDTDALDARKIADNRHNSYLKFTVNAIARCMNDFADSEFANETPESLTRARKLYVAALNLLNTEFPANQQDPCESLRVSIRPAMRLDAQVAHRMQVLNELLDRIDDRRVLKRAIDEVERIFNTCGHDANCIAQAQARVFEIVGELRYRLIVSAEQDGDSGQAGLSHPKSTSTGSIFLLTQSFCIPSNSALQSQRSRAEANLSKLRSGRMLSGLERNGDLAFSNSRVGVAAFDAAGLVGRQQSQRPTQYRYRTLIERAKQLTQIAERMEASMLAFLEKRDADDYGVQRAKADLELAKDALYVQQAKMQEASNGITTATLQRDLSMLQRGHYNKLINSGLLPSESSALDSVKEASFQTYAALTYADWRNGLTRNKDISDKWGKLQMMSAFRASLASAQSAVDTMNGTLERRAQEWEYQYNLASKNTEIGEQQIALAQDHARVVYSEGWTARDQLSIANDTLRLLHAKFTNVELYEWMSGILQDVYGFFLSQATSDARLAENQLAFERQEPSAGTVKSDYWSITKGYAYGSAEPDRKGLTGSARLLKDIYELDQRAFATEKRKLELSKTVSLGQMDPAEFQRFRQTGAISFSVPNEAFDRDFPGHYLRLIKRVRVSVIALIPPTQGIHATLSTNGISRVVVADSFQTAIIRRDPEQIALTSPDNSTGLLDLEPQSDLLLPFEGSGVDATWELRMPPAANPFDYTTINDVLFTIEYTALNSQEYQQKVVKMLGTTSSADCGFSLRNQFPDLWYELNNPEQSKTPMTVTFETQNGDVVPNIRQPKIENLVLFFISKDNLGDTDDGKLTVKLSFEPTGSEVGSGSQGEARPLEGVISTRRTDGMKWLGFIGQPVSGKWTLQFTDEDHTRVASYFKDEKILDIAFIVTYGGQLPPWPA